MDGKRCGRSPVKQDKKAGHRLVHDKDSAPELSFTKMTVVHVRWAPVN